MKAQLVASPDIDPRLFSTLLKAGIDTHALDRNPSMRSIIQKVSGILPGAYRHFYYSFLLADTKTNILNNLGHINYSVLVDEDICLVYASANLQEWLESGVRSPIVFKEVLDILRPVKCLSTS